MQLKTVAAVLCVLALCAPAHAQTPIPLATGTALSASSLGILAPTPTPAPSAAPTPMVVLLEAQDCKPSGVCDAASVLPRTGTLAAVPGAPLGAISTGTAVLPTVPVGDTVRISLGGPNLASVSLPVTVKINGVDYSAAGAVVVSANAPGISTAIIDEPGMVSNQLVILVH